MGFRDLQAFKLDMLVKQAWRLIHHSQALFFQIYKARYFPKCSFMKAKIGNYTSYVWSLLAAREVIFAGSWCCVSDGRNIKVMSINGFPTLRYWLDRFRLPCVFETSLMYKPSDGTVGNCRSFLLHPLAKKFWHYHYQIWTWVIPSFGSKIKLKFSL